MLTISLCYFGQPQIVGVLSTRVDSDIIHRMLAIKTPNVGTHLLKFLLDRPVLISQSSNIGQEFGCER